VEKKEKKSLGGETLTAARSSHEPEFSKDSRYEGESLHL